MSLRFARTPMSATAAVLIAWATWTAWGDAPRAEGEPPAPPSGAAAARQAPQPRLFLGAGSCTSSGCHAAAVAGHAAWQSSFTVWSTRDRHAQAHHVLQEPLAARIVAMLAARTPDMPPVPAPHNRACIGCHATGRGPLAGEGVGCESCHGPAGDWLVPHALPGWRTAGNQLGLIDLADPFVAAQQCAGCHVGGEPAADGAPREVSHDLIAAGHPRLAFELRSFKRAEPPHWRDRFMAADDGPGTKAAVRLDPVDEWALGRFGTLRAFLAQTAGQASAAERHTARDVAAVWPEFSAFDCYGCHRPALPRLDRGSVPASRPGPAGGPRLEPLHWALLDVILPPDTAGPLARLRDDVERRWWRPPEASAVHECLATLDAARAHFHPAYAGLATAEVSARIRGGVDPARWSEAAAALAGFEALLDRAALRGADTVALDVARDRHAALRSLLEFPRVEQPGDSLHYDSPRDYDEQAVTAALDAATAALSALP